MTNKALINIDETDKKAVASFNQKGHGLALEHFSQSLGIMVK